MNDKSGFITFDIAQSLDQVLTITRTMGEFSFNESL